VLELDESKELVLVTKIGKKAATVTLQVPVLWKFVLETS
jgi:hypothetical protein